MISNISSWRRHVRYVDTSCSDVGLAEILRLRADQRVHGLESKVRELRRVVGIALWGTVAPSQCLYWRPQISPLMRVGYAYFTEHNRAYKAKINRYCYFRSRLEKMCTFCICIVKPQLAISVCLSICFPFVCLSVCLSVTKMQKNIFSKTK